jgi:hypothetical protein
MVSPGLSLVRLSRGLCPINSLFFMEVIMNALSVIKRKMKNAVVPVAVGVGVVFFYS